MTAILAKSFIIEVRLGFKYAYEKIETFKIKLRLVKSSRLLQSTAFLVMFVFKTKKCLERSWLIFGVVKLYMKGFISVVL